MGMAINCEPPNGVKKEVEMGGHCWQDGGSKDFINARYEYYATKRNNATLATGSIRTDARNYERSGRSDAELEQVVHTLGMGAHRRICQSTWGGCGRPELDRGMLANAFVAKAVLGLPTTVGLIERLAIDRALRRICGFPMWKKLPDEVDLLASLCRICRGRFGGTYSCGAGAGDTGCSPGWSYQP